MAKLTPDELSESLAIAERRKVYAEDLLQEREAMEDETDDEEEDGEEKEEENMPNKRRRVIVAIRVPEQE